MAKSKQANNNISVITLSVDTASRKNFDKALNALNAWAIKNGHRDVRKGLLMSKIINFGTVSETGNVKLDELVKQYFNVDISNVKTS